MAQRDTNEQNKQINRKCCTQIPNRVPTGLRAAAPRRGGGNVPRPRGGNRLGMFGEEQKAKGRKTQVRNALERRAATPRGTSGSSLGSWWRAAGGTASGGGGRSRNSLEAPARGQAAQQGCWGVGGGMAAKLIPLFSRAQGPPLGAHRRSH